jgi:hypothetical protein
MNLIKTMMIVVLGCVAIVLTGTLLYENASSPSKVLAPSPLVAPHLAANPANRTPAPQA